jgi:hypothetical protein
MKSDKHTSGSKQAAEKLVEAPSRGRFVSGHDFSRAANAPIEWRALQAAEKLIEAA